MLSATDFLPARMTTFMSFETTRFPYFGSGLISRFSALWRRDIGLSLSFGQRRASSRPSTSCLSRSPGRFARRHLRKEAELLRPLCSVFGAPLLAILHALGVEHAAHDVVAHARQVLHAPAADHHDRVLLQIVSLAGDIADHLKAVGKSHLGNLAQGRVRLLRGVGVDPSAHAALLRTLLQCRHLLLRVLRDPRVADQLVDGRHLLACSPSLFRSPAERARNGSSPTRITDERLALAARSALTRFTMARPPRAG